MKMKGVREYAEGMDAEINVLSHDSSFLKGQGKDRIVVTAWNEAGHDCTNVDLLDLLAWVKANRRDLWDATP